MVPNYAYTGPSATLSPYNRKTVKRHYGFGATQQNGTLAAGGVTIGGVNATVSSWSDTQIVVTVPSGVPSCPVQQQAQYGGSAAQCGELVIKTGAVRTGGNVTGVTITRGGSYNTAPTVTFGTAPAGGTNATGTANLGGGRVTSVAVTNGGTGFTSAPTVTFTGGGGSGATATAAVRKHVTAVTITNLATNSYPGTGAITVTFSGAGAGGTTALGTVTTNGGAGTAASPRRVTGVSITTPGNYAIGATIGVTFSVPAAGGTRALGNTTAAGDTTGFVSVVTVAAAGTGTGYTSAPTVGFTGGGGSGATATAAVGDRVVASVTLTNGGGSGYTTAPSGTFSPGLTGGTSTALGTATAAPRQIFSGRRSIDAVTVTIGGKAPIHVLATDSIQAAIDTARPGDMLMINPTQQATATTAAVPAVQEELLLMWKPVRLQGVGAVSSVLDANTHPAGKLDVWRRQVNCLFGLAINGQPMTSGNPYDPSGVYSCADGSGNFSGVSRTLRDFVAYNGTSHINPQIDRLPLEAIVGWNASQNGNMAQLLQEPSLMGALEGAGITVLGKGLLFPAGSDAVGTAPSAAEAGAVPTGTILTDGSTDPTHGCGTAVNPYPSNFYCNLFCIDTATTENSSQGGGGVFVHGWGHELQIANNRITNNSGTLSGGINVGQGEYPPPYIQGDATNAGPGSCEESPVPGAVLPYCLNVDRQST